MAISLKDMTEQQTANTVTKVTAKLKGLMDQCEHVIGKFEENMKTNPRYAFEWSGNAMQAAAGDDVYRRVYMSLTGEDGATLGEMHEYTLREMTRMARSPESSTSTTSNSMDRYALAAWAEVYEMIASVLKYGDPSA